MECIRLVLADETAATSQKLEQLLANYYPIVQMEKRNATLWYLSISTEWTKNDTDFMNALIEGNLLDGWRLSK